MTISEATDTITRHALAAWFAANASYTITASSYDGDVLTLAHSARLLDGCVELLTDAGPLAIHLDDDLVAECVTAEWFELSSEDGDVELILERGGPVS